MIRFDGSRRRRPVPLEDRARGRRSRILVIDAQLEMLALLRAAFERHGYGCALATHLDAAIPVLEAFGADLILVDPLLLYGRSGYVLENRARGLGVPVMAMPGHFRAMDGAVTGSIDRRTAVSPAFPLTSVAVEHLVERVGAVLGGHAGELSL